MRMSAALHLHGGGLQRPPVREGEGPGRARLVLGGLELQGLQVLGRLGLGHAAREEVNAGHCGGVVELFVIILQLYGSFFFFLDNFLPYVIVIFSL